MSQKKSTYSKFEMSVFRMSLCPTAQILRLLSLRHHKASALIAPSIDSFCSGLERQRFQQMQCLYRISRLCRKLSKWFLILHFLGLKEFIISQTCFYLFIVLSRLQFFQEAGMRWQRMSFSYKETYDGFVQFSKMWHC